MLSPRVARIASIAVLSAAFVGGKVAADERAFARAPSFVMPKLSPDGAFLSHVEQAAQRQVVV
ncbi:MAG: hypothetical protein EHM89_19585, partial [Acidobacteria bacterium]